MDDRSQMEDLLLVTKGVCDLYMHGTIESSTPGVLTTFSDSLFDSLSMQADIYKTMEQKGWYKTEPAETNKVAQAYQKFCTNCN
jgi:hypothetical protein